METAFAWIGKLAEWIGAFFPRWVIVTPVFRGVKYVRGRRIVVLGPGIHWYWPATTIYDTYPVVRQADDLRSQCVVTTDDKVIVVGGMIVYAVSDISKLLPCVHSSEKMVEDITITAIHDVCCKLSWEELKLGQRKGTLDTKLKNAAQEQLGEYGVKVIKVQLTDLAPTRVLKLLQSTSQD